MELGGRYEKNYLDVRILNPHASSNRNQGLAAIFTKHKREKRNYEQRIREVEYSTFTLLVLTVSGRMGNQATTFYKCLACYWQKKWDSPYSTTLLVKMSPLLFSIKILNTSHQRSQVLTETGDQVSRSN